MNGIEAIIKKEIDACIASGSINNTSDFKILIYTNTARAFSTTLIGYLFEIAKKYTVVLLSEKLDLETEKALSNKALFPNLERIVPVNQFSDTGLDFFKKNKYLYETAKDAINKFKPSIVISESDMYSIFELYLMRCAKAIKASTIAIQCTNIIDPKTTSKWIDYINACSRFPNYLPLWFRLFLTNIRKYFGHFMYLWIAPLSLRLSPFFGKSSFVLRKGVSGMRYVDYQIVFSEQSYKTHLKSGVERKKLYVILHPSLRPETRVFLKTIGLNNVAENKSLGKSILLLVPSVELGFRRKDWSLIQMEEREEEWIGIIFLINKILPNWRIIIKPHPDSKNLSKIVGAVKNISNIEIVDANNSVDAYIEVSDIILALPWPSTTALFSAALLCPEKPIIALDSFEEVLGNFYENFEGIKYTKNKEDLELLLKTFNR